MNLYSHMKEELEKLCAARVSSEEALNALARLSKLEEEQPSRGDRARGALVGAVVGPASLAANKLVSGQLAAPVKEILATPGLKGRAAATGKALGSGTKLMAGAAAGSAVVGSLLPSIKNKLDRSAENKKLQQYVSQSYA